MIISSDVAKNFRATWSIANEHRPSNAAKVSKVLNVGLIFKGRILRKAEVELVESVAPSRGTSVSEYFGRNIFLVRRTDKQHPATLLSSGQYGLPVKMEIIRDAAQEEAGLKVLGFIRELATWQSFVPIKIPKSGTKSLIRT